METLQPARGTELREAYERQGYLQVPNLGVTTEDLDEVKMLLSGLFARYSDLPSEFAHDMAAVSSDRSSPRFPEINRCTILEPRLLKTRVYAEMEAVAREVIGKRAIRVFDHAMYKPPGKNAPTSWHQDTAYGDDKDTGVAIWLPLQPTSIEDGCLRYVPFSHLGPNLPHIHTLTGEDKDKDAFALPETEFDVTKAISMPLDLGGVCGHDRKMIHGAWPNIGSDTRRAWIVLFSNPSLKLRLQIKAGEIKRALKR
jgi:ectoine hydroxylase-related dioxygenase (phytanoyl-CoA dioxygenase family)